MDTIQVYCDAAGEWRWRRVAANGRVIADSAEGYEAKSDCVEAAWRSTLPVVEVKVLAE